MIDVKEAVKIALDYLGKLYDMKLHDVLLEEVVLSDDEGFWYVTIGFSRPVPSTEPFRTTSATIEAMLGTQKYQREYKVFQIDSDSGQVRSMKMRAA